MAKREAQIFCGVTLSYLLSAAMTFSGNNLIRDGSSFETGYDGFSCFLAYSWTKQGLAGDNPRRGIIDDTTAAHGRCSLKMFFNPPYGRKGFSPWCTFRWIKVAEGRKYTVSLYAKGSRDGQGLTVSVSDNWQDWGWSRFTLTTEWQRYSHEITMGKTEGSYSWVLIPFPEEGVVWIDAVQLEEGELTDYAPGRFVDLGVSCRHPTKVENLFFPGDPVVLKATAFNGGKRDRRVTLDCTVEDYFGEVPYRRTSRFTAVRHAAAVREIDLGAVSKGAYKATLNALDAEGQVLDSEEIVFGVINRRRAIEGTDSPFGMHGFPHPVLEHCGVRWLRSYILAWPAIEPEQGTFSWPEERAEDRLFFENAEKLRIRVLPVLQGTPTWARTDTPAHGGWSKGQSKTATLPQLSAWRRYVSKVVTRYKDRIKHWEVMNEPTAWMNADDYFPFLEAAYEAAKEADPECVVLAGDTANQRVDFLRALAAKGGLNYTDIFAGHFYGVADSGPPEVKIGREGADAVVRLLRGIFAEYGKPDLRIWNTEEGTYVPSWYSKEIVPKSREPWHRVPDVRRQARDMVRSHLLELGSGIEKVFWFYELYSERGADAHWIIRPEGMYAVEYDGAPRPAFVAYSAMTEKLEGCQPPATSVQFGEKIHCFVFSRPPGSVAAVWDWAEQRESNVVLSVPATPGVRVSDIMGNELERDRGSTITLKLSGNPLYIEAADLSADVLRQRLGEAEVR